MAISLQDASHLAIAWRAVVARYPQLVDLACDMMRTRAPWRWPDYWYAWRPTEARLYRLVRDPHDVEIARDVLLTVYRQRALAGRAAA